MQRQAVMQRAHEIARRLEGDYHARMAMALRQAWTEARLLAAGGRRWQRGGQERIYLNDLETLYGLRIERYNTGNIRAAWLDGEAISNNEARRIIWWELGLSVGGGAVWYDCITGEVHHRGLGQEAQRRILSNLQRMGVTA